MPWLCSFHIIAGSLFICASIHPICPFTYPSNPCTFLLDCYALASTPSALPYYYKTRDVTTIDDRVDKNPPQIQVLNGRGVCMGWPGHLTCQYKSTGGLQINDSTRKGHFTLTDNEKPKPQIFHIRWVQYWRILDRVTEDSFKHICPRKHAQCYNPNW